MSRGERDDVSDAGGVRDLVSGETVVVRRALLPDGGGVRRVVDWPLGGGVTRNDDGVERLGVCKFSKALKLGMVTMGDIAAAAPLTKLGNWKCVAELDRPGVPSGCGLSVATGLNELQKCRPDMGMIGVRVASGLFR